MFFQKDKRNKLSAFLMGMLPARFNLRYDLVSVLIENFYGELVKANIKNISDLVDFCIEKKVSPQYVGILFKILIIDFNVELMTKLDRSGLYTIEEADLQRGLDLFCQEDFLADEKMIQRFRLFCRIFKGELALKLLRVKIQDLSRLNHHEKEIQISDSFEESINEVIVLKGKRILINSLLVDKKSEKWINTKIIYSIKNIDNQFFDSCLGDLADPLGVLEFLKDYELLDKKYDWISNFYKNVPSLILNIRKSSGLDYDKEYRYLKQILSLLVESYGVPSCSNFVNNLSCAMEGESRLRAGLISYCLNSGFKTPQVFETLDGDISRYNLDYSEILADYLESDSFAKVIVNSYGFKNKKILQLIEKELIVDYKKRKIINYGFLYWGVLCKCAKVKNQDLIFDNLHEPSSSTMDKILPHLDSLADLSHFFSDKKVLKLLQSLDSQDFFYVKDTLWMLRKVRGADYSHLLSKKVKTWIELHDEAMLLTRKIQQPNYDLDQSRVFSLDGHTEGELSIWIPKKSHDLIEAGARLNNCVGNEQYARKIYQKEIAIIFVNNQGDLSYCCELDLKWKRINQLSGVNNQKAPPYIETWLLSLLSSIS